MTNEKSGLEKAREAADKIRQEEEKAEEARKANIAEIRAKAEAHNKEIMENPQKYMSEVYKDVQNVGTEEIDQSDLNTPTLKVVQDLTKGVDGKHVGWFYRTDTKEQLETVRVNLVYVTPTYQAMNYNQTELENVKIYYGFYEGTNEPFRLYIRGVNFSAHREFQTEVAMYKKLFKLPMFALIVELSTQTKTGTIKDSGKPFETSQVVFKPLKNEQGDLPLVEFDKNKIAFLTQAAGKFRDMFNSGKREPEGDNNGRPF